MTIIYYTIDAHNFLEHSKIYYSAAFNRSQILPRLHCTFFDMYQTKQSEKGAMALKCKISNRMVPTNFPNLLQFYQNLYVLVLTSDVNSFYQIRNLSFIKMKQQVNSNLNDFISSFPPSSLFQRENIERYNFTHKLIFLDTLYSFVPRFYSISTTSDSCIYCDF